MRDEQIVADSFVIISRRKRIFRIKRRGTATLLWTSRADALRYLEKRCAQKLPTTSKGR